MGYPIDFPEKNRTFTAPKGLTKEQVGNLPVKIGIDTELNQIACVSCWQLTDGEIEQLKINKGKVYLKIIGGQPAVCISSFTFNEVKIVTEQELQNAINNFKQ